MIARVRDMVECARHGHTWLRLRWFNADGSRGYLIESCYVCQVSRARSTERRRRIATGAAGALLVLLVALLAYGALAMLDALLGWTA